jgi:hypothetical protein
MSVLAFASVRSCGVTTLAMALAATWPDASPVLLAELDPAGGTLAAASGWPPEPGLVSLAAAARRGGDPDLVWEHCQSLPGRAAVLAGPTAAEQARNAVGMLAGLIGRLGELDADVLIDCGRLDHSSPNLGALARADRVVLVARPRLADLHALATWAEAHPLDGGNVGLVLVGDGPYPDNEITEALGSRYWPACRGTPPGPPRWYRCRHRPDSCGCHPWCGPPGRWPTVSGAKHRGLPPESISKTGQRLGRCAPGCYGRGGPSRRRPRRMALSPRRCPGEGDPMRAIPMKATQ